MRSGVSSIGLRTNVTALRAQRLLAQTSADLSRTFERLASGQRINRASDDAAGLAIADRLRSEARLFNQAKRNLSDGISQLSIIDGTVGEQTGILGRLAELAEQAANGTFSQTQRSTLQNEYAKLVQELGRLGDSATFNGLKLLRGGRADGISQLSLQAGIEGSSNSRISLNSFDVGSVSGRVKLRTGDFDDGSGNGVQDGGIGIEDFLYLVNFGGSSHTSDEIQRLWGTGLQSSAVRDSNGAKRNTLVGFAESLAGAGVGSTDTAVVVFVQDVGAETYRLATVEGVAANQVTEFTFDSGTGKINGSTSFSANLGLAGGGTASLSLDLSGLEFLTSTNGKAESAIDFSGIDSVERARHAMSVISNRLADLGSFRGQIGATQSRLEVASKLSQSAAETRKSAESRIRDSDLGSESANLVRLQILLQTGAAVLAQANVEPQIALQLLGRI